MKAKVIFASVFILLAFPISHLHLYIDDYLFLYNTPSLIQDFPLWASHYITEFGIYRPIAMLYYYLIFSFYRLSPIAAHLFPWALQVISGYLLYKILLRQQLSHFFSLTLGLFFVLHPFASESYMWLGASQGTLVSFIFLLQLIIIPKSLFLIILLSLVSALTYESTLLFFIPILYFLHQKHPTKFIKTAFLSIIPLTVFFFTKFLITPQNPRPLVNNLPSLFFNFSELLKNLSNTHFNSYYQTNFWSNYAFQGYQSFLRFPVLLILLVFSFAFIIFTLYSLPKNTTSTPNLKAPLLFWLLVFLCSLPPLLANQTFYFGFRSLFLPSITGLIVPAFLFQKILRQNSLLVLKTLCLISLPCLIFINTHIANQYEQIYLNDVQLAKNITKLSPPATTIVLKSDVPFDSQNTFLHADHFLSCFFYEWCAPAILKAYSPDTKNIIVKNFDQPLPPGPLLYLLYKQDRSLIITDQKL